MNAEIVELVALAGQSSSSQYINHHICASYQETTGGRMAHAREPGLRQNKLNTSPDSLLANWLRASWASCLMPTSLVPSSQEDMALFTSIEWVQTFCRIFKAPCLGAISNQACSSELCNFFQEETECVPDSMAKVSTRRIPTRSSRVGKTFTS